MRIVLTAQTDSSVDTLFDNALGYDDDMLTKLRLDEALNEAGVLDLTIPQTSLSHFYMDSIVPLKTVVELRYDNELIFRGRAFQPYEGLYCDKGLICEGELAFFKDSAIPAGTVRGTLAEMFASIISAHNAMVDTFKRFAVGSVSVTTANLVPLEIKDPCSTSAALGALIKAYGGYITFSNGATGRQINWIREEDFSRSDQPVKLGQNLLDYSAKLDAGAFATRIYAYGAATNGTRIALPAPGYVENAQLSQQYGTVSKVMLYNDVDTVPDLQAKAAGELSASGNMVKSISVSAIDLGRVMVPNADPELLGYTAWKLGQLIQVISSAHGIDAWYRLSARTADLLDPSSDVITLGGTPVTLTGEIS